MSSKRRTLFRVEVFDICSCRIIEAGHFRFRFMKLDTTGNELICEQISCYGLNTWDTQKIPSKSVNIGASLSLWVVSLKTNNEFVLRWFSMTSSNRVPAPQFFTALRPRPSYSRSRFLYVCYLRSWCTSLSHKNNRTNSKHNVNFMPSLWSVKWQQKHRNQGFVLEQLKNTFLLWLIYTNVIIGILSDKITHFKSSQSV